MHISHRSAGILFLLLLLIVAGVVNAASTALTPASPFVDLDGDGINDMRLVDGVSPACSLGVFDCGDLEMLNGAAATDFMTPGTYAAVTYADALAGTYGQSRLYIGAGNGVDKPFIVLTSGGTFVKVVNTAWNCCPAPDFTFDVLGSVPAGFTPAVASTLPQPPDARLNWRGGDNIAVVYEGQDDSGAPALHIYTVNSASQGEILLVVTAADFGALLAAPPAEHTLVASAGAVAVYILTTGEVQINITEQATGKIYVTILNWESMAVTSSYTLEP